MSGYAAEVRWERGADLDFLRGGYSRRHIWRFDGGAEVVGSSSPLSVPVPMSDASAVDPEEAFVASLASCHMLWFLAVAAKRRFTVDAYIDAAVGTLGKNALGQIVMTRVVLRPQVTFSPDRLPSNDEIDQLHYAAHAACYIANSVKTEVLCKPVYPAR